MQDANRIDDVELTAEIHGGDIIFFERNVWLIFGVFCCAGQGIQINAKSRFAVRRDEVEVLSAAATAVQNVFVPERLERVRLDPFGK